MVLTDDDAIAEKARSLRNLYSVQNDSSIDIWGRGATA